MAVKKSAEAGYTRPILIGDREKMERLAGQVQYDISGTEKIYEKNRQAIADLGISMLFSGEVDIAGKGQIPTAYVYRAQSSARRRGPATGMVVSVVTLWDVPGARPPHLPSPTRASTSRPDLPGQGRNHPQCRLSLTTSWAIPEAEDLRSSPGKCGERTATLPSYQDLLEHERGPPLPGDLGCLRGDVTATSLQRHLPPGRTKGPPGGRQPRSAAKTRLAPHPARSQPCHRQHPRASSTSALTNVRTGAPWSPQPAGARHASPPRSDLQ